MNPITKILENLNEKQHEVVKKTEGYVRVIAGAGSGKTKALTSRYAYLVEGLGINPSNILCVTFTNKAAQEMRKRVRSIVGEGKDTGYITTYHGFCVRVLKEDINVIHYPRDFVIMDVEDQKTLLRDVYSSLHLSSKDFSFKRILSDISLRKKGHQYVDWLADTNNNQPLEDASLNIKDQIFKLYLKKQKKNFALDFDDLINFTFFIFSNYPQVLEKWQKRLQYIQVDETQDSSVTQFDLIKMLSDFHKNLFVVGDPDQTIYEWRGAVPELLINFDKTYPSCKTIIMNQNYRSTPDILSVGNYIIKNNRLRVDKDLFTKKESGLKVIHFHGKSEAEEGLWISKTIKKLHKNDNVKYKDMAVLYRANYISRYIEQSFIREDIEYTIYGGIRFFERKEIKDSLAYLRLVSIGDDLSFLRIINEPKRGLGKKFIQNLILKSETDSLSLLDTLKTSVDSEVFNRQGARDFLKLIENSIIKSKALSVSDLLQFILNETGIIKRLREDGDEDRIDNVNEFMSSIMLFEKEAGEEYSLSDYLQEIALYTNIDYKEETDRVKLMTIHTSKGLEFSHVFLCGMSEGILPSFRSMRERKARALEEERRLTYVAITRAMSGLYLTESEGFNYNSGDKYPSRFIFEIEKNFITQIGEIDTELIEQSKQYINRLNHLIEQEDNSFSINEFVLHQIFGKGQIIKIDSEKKEYQIKFEKRDILRTISMDYQFLKSCDQKDKKKSIIIVENIDKTAKPNDELSTVIKEKKKKRRINWFWLKQKDN